MGLHYRTVVALYLPGNPSVHLLPLALFRKLRQLAGNYVDRADFRRAMGRRTSGWRYSDPLVRMEIGAPNQPASTHDHRHRDVPNSILQFHALPLPVRIPHSRIRSSFLHAL